MALWQSKPKVQVKTGNNTEPITLDGGVNRHGAIFNIGKNEAWDCKNTTSKIKGVLSVKPSDTAKVTGLYGGIKPFSDTVALLGLNSYTTNVGASIGVDFINILCQDPDNAAKYYVVRYNPSTGIPYPIEYPLTADRESTIMSVQTATEDYTIVCNTQGVYEMHSGAYTEITNAPKTPIYTYDDNRLFALKGNKLSWCDPSDITNWTTGESGNIIITEMRGGGSAIITMNDAVYCFSGKSLHILYGDDTGNYTLSNTIDVGCVGFRAVAKYKDSIYFVDFDGLKVYNAGQVSIVSKKINYWLNQIKIADSFSTSIYSYAVLGINGDYLYLSFETSVFGTNNITFEINLETGVIHKWDEGYKGFTKVGQRFYGLKSTGLYEIGTKNNHTSSWEYLTGMNFEGFNKQIVSSIPILLDLPIGSTLKVAFNTNPNTPSWKDIYTFAPSANVQRVIVNIPITDLNNVDWYQLKFYGTGPCTIHYIGTDERVRIR